MRGVYRQYEECHRIVDGVIYKLCSDCNQWLPMTEDYFYKNKSSKQDGFNPYCKEDSKKRSMQWNKENPEKYEISKKKMRKTKHWKLMNRKWNKTYVENGKRKEWIENNPDKMYLYAQNHRHHDIDSKEWGACKQYFNYKCAYCGISEKDAKEKYGNYLHKEHVHHDGANDLSNCIPACKSCNSQKRTYAFEQWYNENNKRFTVDRYNKIIKWIEEDHKLYIKLKTQ